ncbi:MAG: nucleotidyltransferase family protein [Clostridia bacterium]|nr:nucleotidyltransferase family protein [Clostridia bacterium]
MDLNTSFLDAVRASLRGEAVEWSTEDIPGDIWLPLFRKAEDHHVLPMVYESVCRSPAGKAADPAVMAAAKRHTVLAVIGQTRKSVEFHLLLTALQNAGITPMVVKGIVCRSLYPNPDARLSADEDVLIPSEQFPLCHQAMLDFGMELADPGMDIAEAYEVTYYKKDSALHIELHKSLFPGESEAVGDFNRFFETAGERKITLKTDGGDIPTLDHTDHLFYLICHAFKHFLHSGFGIRQVCDICLYANTYGSVIDWEQILENCREIRADLFAAALFAIGKNDLGFDAQKACFPGSWQSISVDETDMLDDLLDAGVYGSSSMSRKHSSNITLHAAAAEKRGKKAGNGVWKSVFLPAKSMERQYPYLKKRPYLLPIAWIQRLWRYFREVLGGNDQNKTAESIRIGKERVELMQKYGIIR